MKFVDVQGSITNLNDIDEDEKYFAEMKRLVKESKRRKSSKKPPNDVESTLNVSDLPHQIPVPVAQIITLQQQSASDPAIHYETETKLPDQNPSLSDVQLRKYEETSF